MQTSFFDRISGGLGKRAFVALFLLAAADVFMFAIPFYLQALIPNINNHLNITEVDYQRLISALGYASLCSYLFTGLFADKLNPRKLSCFSLFLTSLLTFWWCIVVFNAKTTSSFILMLQYYAIYILWGISGVLLFWSPLWKLVAQQAPQDKQSVSVGVHGSLNGLIGLTLLAGGALFVSFLTAKFGKLPFVIFGFFIATLLALLGLGVLLLISEKEVVEEKNTKTTDTKALLKIFLSPKIWMMGLVVLGTYVFQSAIVKYFLIQIFSNVLKVPDWVITIVGAISIYLFRLGVSKPFGTYAEKSKWSYIQLIAILSTLTLIFLLIWIFILPSDDNIIATYSSFRRYTLIGFAILLLLLCSIVSWAIVAIRFTQAKEVRRPPKSYGSAVALISLVAYSSDSWFLQLTAKVTENYQYAGHISAWGYKLALIMGMVVLLVGTICSIVLVILQKIEMKKGINPRLENLDDD